MACEKDFRHPHGIRRIATQGGLEVPRLALQFFEEDQRAVEDWLSDIPCPGGGAGTVASFFASGSAPAASGLVSWEAVEGDATFGGTSDRRLRPVADAEAVLADGEIWQISLSVEAAGDIEPYYEVGMSYSGPMTSVVFPTQTLPIRSEPTTQQTFSLTFQPANTSGTAGLIVDLGTSYSGDALVSIVGHYVRTTALSPPE